MKMEKLIGILTGLFLCFFVGSFCLTNRTVFIHYILKKSDKGMVTLINIITWSIILITSFFILRHYATQKKRTLTAYYRQSIVVSVSVVLLFFSILFFLFVKLIVENQEANHQIFQSLFWETNGSFLILILVFVVFFLTFHGCTGKKIRYITMMSEKVKELERDGFGNTIEVIGDDELAELCQSINHMSVELSEKEKLERETERKKNELITNVSHDLRSPLTSIIGYVDLLKQENISPDEYRQYIDVVDRRLHGLNALIGELFELTKLDSPEQKLQLTDTDMKLFLSHMTEEYAIFFLQKKIHLETELLLDNCSMQIDTEKFTRAMRNLLDNAGKYSADGKIFLQAHTETPEENPLLVIRISNPIKDAEKISLDSVFDRFYKGDIARSDGSSSGLGLAITKRIIELHGGKIDAEIRESTEKNTENEKEFSVGIKMPYV